MSGGVDVLLVVLVLDGRDLASWMIVDMGLGDS